MVQLRIAPLVECAEAHGIRVHRLPIHDGSIPTDPASVRAMVAQIAAWASAGESVVIHCKGGLGRAGTIGGCVLRSTGMDADAALSALSTARGPHCPETAAQIDYIRGFQAGPPNTASRILGTVLGAAIGDAVGHPTEFKNMDEIRAIYGPHGVQGFELYWERDGRTFAPYTDDTQMAEIVLRVLCDSRRDSLDLDTTR